MSGVVYPTGKFLSHFGNVEVNDLKRILLARDVTPESKDLYWLGGVRPGLYVRAKDADVVSKNYFAVDFDIFNEYKKAGYELTTDEVLGVIDDVRNTLDAYDLFKEWSFIVFSGRGMHVYYLGRSRAFDRVRYSDGVNRIYKMLEAFLNSDFIKPDYACKNIARVLRLPGTINSKNGERCRILYANPKESRLFENLEAYAEEEAAEREKERAESKKEFERRNAAYALRNGNQENFYEKINRDFPASFLAEEFIGFKLAPNGRNFINEHGGYTGYYYDKKNNLIMNGGSTHYFLNHSGYNPFMIVKEFLKLDDRDTFEYFRKQFNSK